MRVRVQIPEAISRYSDDRLEVDVDVEPARATVGGALEALFALYPALRSRVLDAGDAIYPYLIVYVGDEPVGRARAEREATALPTAPGAARVEIVAAAEGGAPEPGEHGAGDADGGGDADGAATEAPAGAEPEVAGCGCHAVAGPTSAPGPASPSASAPASVVADVRMQGFARRMTVASARAAVLAGVTPLAAEDVPLLEAAGRVLAEPIASDVDVPPFARSAMDGYAVRAEDTLGATPYTPARLRLVGEVLAGSTLACRIGPGLAVRAMTGAPLPEGADAVVMAERAEEEEGAAPGERFVRVSAAVPSWKHVGRVGEDIRAGTLLLDRGRRLRPQDVGVLASVGRGAARAVRRPRVRIIATGDELLPLGERAGGGRIVDSNTPMLAALIARDGGLVERALRVADDRHAIARALLLPGADAIVCTGGTSVGREDWLPLVVEEIGQLLVHGIACRPAAPAGAGRVGGVPVLLLPGNPVSCLAAYDLLAGPLVRTLGGLPAGLPYPRRSLRLARKLASELGRLDYVRVLLDVDGGVEPLAAGGASVLSSTTRAVGFTLVPEDAEGFAEGAEIEVYLYDLHDPGGPNEAAAARPAASPTPSPDPTPSRGHA